MTALNENEFSLKHNSVSTKGSSAINSSEIQNPSMKSKILNSLQPHNNTFGSEKKAPLAFVYHKIPRLQGFSFLFQKLGLPKFPEDELSLIWESCEIKKDLEYFQII